MICSRLLLLSSLLGAALAARVDVNGVAIAGASQASGSLDDAEVLVQEETQVMNTLVELDSQLDQVLQHLSSARGAVEIDVVVEESGGSTAGAIEDEIAVVIPPAAGSGPRLSDEEKENMKEEIESEVAGALDAMLVDRAVQPPEAVAPEGTDSSFGNKVERLFEEEAEAEQELTQMKEDLKAALDDLPSAGGPTEIDIEVTESDDDNQQEIVDEEIVVVIPASTGSGPGRLTEAEKEQIEEEVVDEAANALGTIIMKDFVGGEEDSEVTEPVTEKRVDLPLPDAPVLEEDSPQENALAQRAAAPMAEENIVLDGWKEELEPKPALRSGVAAAIAQPGHEHPMFVPHRWQMPPDEQLWTMKLSMLTSISCLTLLLIVGVWTGVRRSRRHAVLDDNHFRWAETVEYMDAFPYDQ
ncbi:unnamed protein product [Phytophthora lilii]|uniref:Unnamed protein product n=1 Tax=Phytophthora lilii TaxID=2077276 RepID=A0A9W7CKB5_9STRA|nr:unnamed protein product [Phytophthora lilii]